jgi:glycosyltransferase involved in cell wall biosynthesis
MGCRLLYVTGWLHTGGQERQLYYLLRTMDRARYKPAVAVWRYREEDIHVPRIQALRVPIHPFSPAWSGAAKLRAFRRLVRQLQPEVIHSYGFYTNFAASWGAWGTRAVAVGSVRSAFAGAEELAGPWLGRLCYRWPRHQIYNSSSAAETARHARSLFVPRHLYVVRNGLDLARFPSSPLATDGPVRILGVGYLLPVKRWDRLLRAARELKRRGLDYLIRIAGDGPLRGPLEQQAKDLGVLDRVEFLGHRDDIPALLTDATFLVHTAEHEGCPNAVMEAMACGRAVVAMDAGDIASLVDEGKTGFVVPQGDASTLVERMLQLMAERDLCQHMGAAGRAKAERTFTLARLVTETLAAYRAAGGKDI